MQGPARRAVARGRRSAGPASARGALPHRRLPRPPSPTPPRGCGRETGPARRAAHRDVAFPCCKTLAHVGFSTRTDSTGLRPNGICAQDHTYPLAPRGCIGHARIVLTVALQRDPASGPPVGFRAVGKNLGDSEGPEHAAPRPPRCCYVRDLYLSLCLVTSGLP